MVEMMFYFIFGSVLAFIVLFFWMLKSKNTPEENTKRPTEQEEEHTGRPLTQEEGDVVDRYSELYREVPLWGGKEWKELSLVELTTIHHEAAKLLAEHHGVPLSEIITQMIERASDLSEWMQKNKSRKFYMGSDMRPYIDGPIAVSKELTKLL